ncbi:MAG: hypothetical protein ACI4JF_09925 [Oscillospiraceae bacterium]
MFAVKGYFNGDNIILDEDVDIEKGQEVIVTVLPSFKTESVKPDLSVYMGRGNKMFDTDAGIFIDKLRGNDRAYC